MTTNTDKCGEADFDVSKDIDINVNSVVDAQFDPVINYESCLEVDHDISSDVCLDGNSAQFEGDVEALGDDSLAELNVNVLTTDDMSCVWASAVSAVG